MRRSTISPPLMKRNVGMADTRIGEMNECERGISCVDSLLSREWKGDVPLYFAAAVTDVNEQDKRDRESPKKRNRTVTAVKHLLSGFSSTSTLRKTTSSKDSDSSWN